MGVNPFCLVIQGFLGHTPALLAKNMRAKRLAERSPPVGMVGQAGWLGQPALLAQGSTATQPIFYGKNLQVLTPLPSALTIV